MSDIQVPPLHEHSLIAIPIDPAGPDVDVGEPHDIQFESEAAFQEWFKGQQRQCNYNRTKNEGPEVMDAAIERMRRVRNQDADAPVRQRIPRNWTRHEEYDCQFSGMYTIHEQERRANAHVEKVGPVKPRKGKPSFKSHCRAKLCVWYQIDRTVKVSYHWRHNGHDILSADHFRRKGLSRETKKYIEDILRNIPGATKKTVRKIIAVPEHIMDNLSANLPINCIIDLLNGQAPGETLHLGHRIKPMDIFNAARRVTLANVRPLMDSTQPGAAATALRLQVADLRANGWKAQYGVAVEGNGREGEKYWVGLVAPWMMTVLHAYGRKVCMDSTHNCGKGFAGEKIFLYSLVVRNRQTGGLSPGAWMLTNSEAHQPVEKWLVWLKDELSFVPDFIMIDMSVTEMRAILNAYAERNPRPRVHWCYVHLKKAWDENARQRIPAEGDLGEPGDAWRRLKRQLDTLIDAETVELFNERLLRMIAEWNGMGYHSWIEYFTRSYVPFREQWGGPWRKDFYHSINDNNLIEAFHSTLKEDYIGKDKKQPIDFLIYTLAHSVSTHFFSRWLGVRIGSTERPPFAKERSAKEKADKLTPAERAQFIVLVDDLSLRMRSHTDPANVMYTLRVNMPQKWIHECDCPAFQPWHLLCKHIYTFLRSYPNFYYRDSHWDNMLPENVVARQLVADGNIGLIQRPIRPLPRGARPANDPPVGPGGNQMNEPARNGAAQPPNLDGRMAEFEARRQALIDQALEAMRRQHRHQQTVKLLLEEDRVLGQVLPGGNGEIRERFTVAQLEEIIGSCDSNRRVLTAVANDEG